MNISITARLITLQHGHALHCIWSIFIIYTCSDGYTRNLVQCSIGKNDWVKKFIKNCTWSNLHFSIFFFFNNKRSVIYKPKELSKFPVTTILSIINCWWSTKHCSTTTLILLNPDLRWLSVPTEGRPSFLQGSIVSKAFPCVCCECQNASHLRLLEVALMTCHRLCFCMFKIKEKFKKLHLPELKIHIKISSLCSASSLLCFHISSLHWHLLKVLSVTWTWSSLQKFYSLGFQ